MLKHLYLILISTFIIGFISGMYVYFLTKPEIKADDPDVISSRGYELTAEAYGGCSRIGCPSYRLNSKGAYTYLPQVGSGVRFEGELARAERNMITELIEESDLQEFEDSEFRGSCPVITDGLAYSFEIRVEGQSYDIDTCANDVDGEEVIDVLVELFGTFEGMHRNE